LPWQRAVRALTVKELVALAVPSNSLDQLAKVRVAMIRALVALAVPSNSLDQLAKARVATIRARSVFLAKAIGFAAVTSRASTSYPKPVAAC